MHKRVPKKRRAKKSVLLQCRLVSIKWAWLLALLTIASGCLIGEAYLASSSRAPTVAPPPGPTVPGTYAALPTQADIAGTPQTTGIFSLATGGPIPVPANELHPTSIARVLINNVLTSIYAGSLTRTPALGALAILQEDLATGQQSLRLYPTAQPVGALTILAVHNDILTLSSPKAHGSFNLATDQFHFSWG